MTAETAQRWAELNQRHLDEALGAVRELLEHHIAHGRGEGPAARPRITLAQRAEGAPQPALEQLCAAFALSAFERDLLLLCAGAELDGAFPALLAEAHGDPGRPHPTFGLALAALPEAHWGALTPGAALRRWRLVEVGPGNSLVGSPLRIDERVLHFLCGARQLDERLAALVEPLPAEEELPPSHGLAARQVAAAWAAAGEARLPVAQLGGGDRDDRRAIAAHACALLGLEAYALPARSLPVAPAELDQLARLWEREAALGGCALLLECDELDGADGPREHAVELLAARLGAPLVIAGGERRRVAGRPTLAVDVPRPSPAEQRSLWQAALGPAADREAEAVGRLVGHFRLGPAQIRAAAAAVELSGAEPGEGEGADVDERLWEACRSQARPRLSGLAQRIEPAAGWDDLVLPEAQRAALRTIATHMRQRGRVYEEWGFGGDGQRGLGVSALFAGASGTGKTLAAEVLAGELRLDLYKIDLSQVVSKYIGETEKNLGRVFDAAEAGGAILLFDEADALFGKRSEVKDSHDRYANIEVSYLLQRMEQYRGLAILTTNLKEALDQAFLRRIRFVVQFPFPDATQRAAIWRRAFPAGAPTEGLDAGRLARLSVAGGNIRNIALGAAFLAAEAGEPVRMAHLLEAARGECAKLERPLAPAEVAGWV